MYRFFCLSVLLVVLLAIPGAVSAMNEWTIVIYQCADDSSSSVLEDAAIRDLCELDSVGSQGGLEIIAQIDRGTKLSNLMQQVYADPNYSGANRFLIKKDKWVSEGKLGEVNMGSPKTLSDCLKWAARSHRAKHYFVVLAGHGSGVFSWKGTGSVSSANPGEVSPFGDYDEFVAYDSTDNDCLTVFEVAEVFNSFNNRYNNGNPIDVVAFDSCNAGMIEVFYQLRKSAGIAIASASTVPMCGLDYRAIARAIANNNQINPEILAQKAAEAFINEAPCQGDGDIMTAVRQSDLDEFVYWIDALSQQLMAAMNETGKSFAVNNLVSYNKNYWDIKRMAAAIVNGNMKLNGASNYEYIQECAQKVLYFRSKCVISLWYGGGYASQKVGGISIAWPDAKEYRSYRNFYKKLDFAVATSWDEVLDLRELGVR